VSELVIISGTNRNEAISPTIAKVYLALAKEANIDSDIIDLQELPIDYIGSALYDNAGKNAEFNQLREKMKAAKKFAFIIPEYNGSFPGVLKAFIDGLDFPHTFRGKKAALVGVSAGALGSTHAMSHFTDILNYCGTHVLARKPRLTKISDHIAAGNLTNDGYLDQLQKQIIELKDF